MRSSLYSLNLTFVKKYKSKRSLSDNSFFDSLDKIFFLPSLAYYFSVRKKVYFDISFFSFWSITVWGVCPGSPKWQKRLLWRSCLNTGTVSYTVYIKHKVNAHCTAGINRWHDVIKPVKSHANLLHKWEKMCEFRCRTVYVLKIFLKLGPNSWKQWSLNTVVFASCFWKEISRVIDWLREMKMCTNEN